MKFDCELCNYSTNDRSNWARHNKTPAHIKNINQTNEFADGENKCPKFVCLCGKMFAYKQTLIRHEKTKCDKNKIIGNKIIGDSNEPIYKHAENSLEQDQQVQPDELKKDNNVLKHNELLLNQIEELKKDKDELKKDKDELKKNVEYFKLLAKTDKEIAENDKKYFKSLVNQSGNMITGAISALSYVTKYFTNTPVLKSIDNYTDIEEYCGEYGLPEGTIRLYRDDRLIPYLGRFIIKHYKTADPSQQSVWNSDTNRLSYIVRSLVKGEPSWISDKKGVHIKEKIIHPLLEKLDGDIETFMFDPTTRARKDHSEIMASGAELLINIRKSIICNELVKFLAPYFQFSHIKPANLFNYGAIDIKK